MRKRFRTVSYTHLDVYKRQGLRGGKIAPDGPQLGEVYTVTGIRATSTEDRAVRLDRAVGGYSKGTYWSISRFNQVVKVMVLYPGDKEMCIRDRA